MSAPVEKLPPCWIEGCTEPGDYVCASCGRNVCDEHGRFSLEADEFFCALAPESYRYGETITLCDERLPKLRAAAGR